MSKGLGLGCSHGGERDEERESDRERERESGDFFVVRSSAIRYSWVRAPEGVIFQIKKLFNL